MLIRITLIVAIIAGLAVGVLNFVMVKDKVVTLKTNLQETTDTLRKTETELRSTKKELTETSDKLKQTEAALNTATEERDRAVADASAATKKAEKLTEDLNRTRAERDTAQAELARYNATGLRPEQITIINNQIKDLQNTLAGTEAENRVLGTKIRNLQARLDRYEEPDKAIRLPADLKGTVLVTDPKWNFVVVSVGQDQGVLEYGELLVNRNGKLVGKLVVRSVQKDRSIANVLPGWQLGEILEGDQVIPAHPAS